MSSKKKTATPYHAKSTTKSGAKISAPERATARIRQKALAAVEAPRTGDMPSTERDDTTLADVFPVPPARKAEVNADPDRVPLSQAMKKPGKPKGSKKPAAAKPAKAPKAAAEPKAKKLSGLDAAAQVLASAKEPMNSKDLVKVMSDQGLWTSPGGKTPHSTLYAAMLREINEKGIRRKPLTVCPTFMPMCHLLSLAVNQWLDQGKRSERVQGHVRQNLPRIPRQNRRGKRGPKRKPRHGRECWRSLQGARRRTCRRDRCNGTSARSGGGVGRPTRWGRSSGCWIGTADGRC